MKKRSQLDSIAVGKPCSQDWNKMYGNDEVRFCEHCVKQVHDLSAMTRRKAERFVVRSRSQGSKVCVRYVRRPDGKVQTVSDKLYQISGRASRLAASVFGASLTLASAVYAQQNDPSAAPTVQEAKVRPQAPANNTPNSETPVITDTVYVELPQTEHIAMMGDMAVAINYENQLVLAVHERNIERVKELITQNVDVNLKDKGYGITALHLAVQNGDAEIVELLLNAGAKANARDISRRTPLMMISGYYYLPNIAFDGSVENDDADEAENSDTDQPVERSSENSSASAIFKLLISHGATVNLRDDQGTTALMHAAQYGEVEVLRLLLSQGADVNLRANEGRTALMDAIGSGGLECVRALLDAGADVEAKDTAGETVMSLCTDEGIRQLLIAHGAHEEEPEEGSDEEPSSEPAVEPDDN